MTLKIKNLNELQDKIGVHFQNEELLELAFVHKSYVNEHPEVAGYNERLEFLGDAVLELAVTDFLYHNYPDQPEGQLTNWRSALVKGKNLARVSRSLGLGEYLLLSRGEELSGGRVKDYILANTQEALIGAIYLDKGFEMANQFILRNIVILLDEIIAQGLNIDAKSRIQELAQDRLGVTPRYELLNESGPDHEKTFEMGVYFGETLAGQGNGPSKQEAEQAAAKNGLQEKGWA